METETTTKENNTDVESTRQYVVFQIEDESYGLDIQTVQGIEKIRSIARVPRAPECIEGVMNLRGEILPVMNLRKAFKLDEKEYDDDTRIIIVKIDDSLMGLTVDEVKEVLVLNNSDIENAQGLEGDESLDYISGIGKFENGTMVITLLNLNALVGKALT